MAEITKELGRIPVSRGDYQATIEYYKDNIVQYKRGSYQVVSESPIVGVSPTNDNNVVNPGWTLFAGTLDAQDVVNQIKEQEAKSIQAVADREAEILAKLDAAEVSFDNTGTSLSGTNVQDALEETDGKISELESEVIYDVTANNNGITFPSLSALLSSENLSTLIPTSVRHGGMSIRFVQSSDNKYVQYRYIGTATTGSLNPFLNTANWQGVDNEPTIGSNNLVKSGGVADSINKLKNAGYLYAGIATPTTNPGTPDGHVFYIAAEPGVYSNFSNITVDTDEAAILVWKDGDTWEKEVSGFASSRYLMDEIARLDETDNEIKARLEDASDKQEYNKIKEALTETYSYGNTDVTTTVQRVQKCWVYNEALNSSRTISSVIISTDYNGEAQIVIVDGSTNSVVRTHTIILSGRETDVSSYNIKVNAGERLGLACNTLIIGHYTSTTGYQAEYFSKYPISVGDSISTGHYSIDVAFIFADYIDIKELNSRLKGAGYDKQEYTDFTLKGFYRNDTGLFVADSNFLASELIEISQPTIVEFDTSVSVNNQSYISPVIKFNADKIITGIVNNGDLITEKSYVAYSCFKVAKSFCLRKFSPVWNDSDSGSVTIPLNDYLVNGYYLTSTNKEYSYPGFCKSLYIPVFEGDKVSNTYKTDVASQILVYDEQKNFIKNASNIYTVESKGFVRISFAWKYYSSTFAPDTYSEIYIIRSKEKDEIERNKQYNVLNTIPYNKLTDVPETIETTASTANAFINLFRSIEYRKTDLATTIENIGRAYLYENKDTGSLELRIVKDISTIVGCELSVKKTIQKTITSKSFSMVHFGDSITVGVGSDEGKHYTDVIKDSLISYGHTITNQVNKGISGEYCESYYAKVLSYDKEHFDIATLMIGVNDRDRWYTVKGGTYEQFAEFRKWYRKYLRLLIDAIFNYCTPRRLYLITPYYYRDQLFTDITTDECIYAARDIENVHLCRGDIYIQNGELGGLHVNNEGALLLGTEVAKEMAPDISTISDL